MDILLKYFPDITPLQQEQYNRLHDLILEWNQRMNLISRKDIDYLMERHILHSLGIALHACFSAGDTVVDVGTGGGFPGLPLAIMYPETRFILIDSIGKKINAVNQIYLDLDIRNVQCIKTRAENFKGRTHHMVCRAVTRLDRLTEWIRHIPLQVPESDAPYGLWCLKGGDLKEELAPFPNAKVFNLNDSFQEPFFDSKKLVLLTPKSLL